MNDETNLSDTIVPKSDQLNADDLRLGEPITVRVQAVKRGATADQPISIELDGGHRPYKPCKSMRRVLIAAWGANGRDWVGRSMRLYCDPKVTFGGVAVGGIRISHLSHLPQRTSFMLTTKRASRSPFIVESLVVESKANAYPLEAFKRNLPAWRKAIADGKMTPGEVIKRAEKIGELTDEQKGEISK